MKSIFDKTQAKNRIVKYHECWNKIGFNYSKEKNIYNYLCENKKYKSGRKLEENQKFNVYSEWEEYLRIKYLDVKDSDLCNFYKYLKLKKRKTEENISRETNILLPVLIALITSVFSTQLFRSIEIADGISITIIMTFGMIILFCSVNPLYKILISKWDVYFLNDYMEIIDKIIKEKQNKSEYNN